MSSVLFDLTTCTINCMSHISILWGILMTFWNDCSPHPCLRTKLIFPKLKLEESFCLGNQRSQGNRCLIISIHEFRIPPCWSISKRPSSPNRTPWKINMEPQIIHVERNMIWTKPPWLCSMLTSGVSSTSFFPDLRLFSQETPACKAWDSLMKEQLGAQTSDETNSQSPWK